MSSTHIPVLVLLLVSQACAAHRTPATPEPAPITRYTFAETLPAETQVCVSRSPWDSTPMCMQLGALREQLRHVRYASLR